MVLKNVNINDTWKQMENLVKINNVKEIGVSNFNTALLTQIMNSSEIKPTQLQIEFASISSTKKYVNENLHKKLTTLKL